MGAINIDNTGSGGDITLSSDGTNLLVGGTAVGGGSAFDTPEVKTANWSVSNSDKGKVFIVDTDNLTLTLPQYSTLDDDWFIRVYTKGDDFQPSYGNPGDLTIDPQYSTYSGRVNDNTNWVMKSRQGGLLFKDPERSNNFIFDTHSTNWDIDTNSTTNANRANATGWGSVAILGQATASGTNSISIGYLATASGTDSVAIGSNSASATGTDAIALGNSYASGTDSVAMGITNNTLTYGSQGNGSIAIGTQAKSTAEGSVALGEGTVASGTLSAALGAGADATAIYSVAIGRLSDATATRAFSIGYGSTASGSDAYAFGKDATASGSNSVAIGPRSSATAASSLSICTSYANYGNASSALNSITIGDGNAASETSSVAIGYGANAAIKGKFVYASGSFSDGNAEGSAQGGQFILRADTTDATATDLTTNNSTPAYSNQISLPNHSAYAFHGTIVARESGTDGTECAAWRIEGLIRRENGQASTVLVNSATTVLDNTYNWGMALSANTSTGSLKIEVTGAASTNIRWVATIHTSEVTYA